MLTLRGPVLGCNAPDFLVAIDNAWLGAIQADYAQVTASLDVPGVSDLLAVARYRLYNFRELRGLQPRTLIGEAALLPGLEVLEGEVAGAPVRIGEESPIGEIAPGTTSATL